MSRLLFIVRPLCLVLAMAVGAFAASWAETVGFSAEGIAKGNTGVSTVHDWSSVFYNSAGLGRTHYGQKSTETGTKTMALIKKTDETGTAAKEEDEFYPNEICLGFMYLYPMLEVDYASGSQVDSQATDDLDYGALMIGVAFDANNLYKLPEKIISSCRLGLGLVTNWDLSVAQVNDVDLRSHNFLMYGREQRRLSGFLALGVGFLKDMFGIGIGINASFAGEGKVVLDNVLVSSDPQTPEGQAKLDLALSPYAVCGFYFDFGKVVTILEGLSMGSCYRQESYLEVDPFPTIAIIQNGNIQMDLILAIFDYYSPHNISWGISYSRWGVTLEFDMEHQLWSMYKISSTATTVIEDQLGLEKPEYQDIFVYKIGISYEALKWLSVSVGYQYMPTFVPDDAVNDSVFNPMDNDKHIASLGATFKVPKFLGTQGPILVTVAYQFQYLMPRDVTKNQTEIVNSLPAGYPYNPALNPNYSYGGMAHAIAFALTFQL